MKIETGQVCQALQQFSGMEPADILELGQETLFQVISDVRYNLTAQRFVGELLVRGVLEVDVRGRCARCGEWFNQTVRDGNFACAYPLSAANELIDLTPDIREAILLALPMNFVCSEECRGLCVQCGANLNKAPCTCGKARQAIPWGMLDRLKIERK